MNINIDEEKLQKIKDNAIENHVPILQDDSLRLIEVLLSIAKPKRILEIGTAVGYSASIFSRYLDIQNDECFVKTIEINENMYKEAINNIKELKLEKYINVILADATVYLKDLKEDNLYDVVFIDAAKGQYMVFLNEAKRLVKNSGIIIADNVLFKGRVLSDYNDHKHRTAVNRLREYIDSINNDSDLKSTVLNVGDGVAISIVNK